MGKLRKWRKNKITIHKTWLTMATTVKKKDNNGKRNNNNRNNNNRNKDNNKKEGGDKYKERRQNNRKNLYEKWEKEITVTLETEVPSCCYLYFYYCYFCYYCFFCHCCLFFDRRCHCQPRFVYCYLVLSPFP